MAGSNKLLRPAALYVLERGGFAGRQTTFIFHPLMALHLRNTSLALSLCLLLLPLRGSHAGPADALTPDGGSYFGRLVDGQREGAGRVEWPNGARYEGDFHHGRYDGKGVLVTASGVRYAGEFSQGVIHGYGRLDMRDGSVYVGQFRNDAFHGRGRYEMASGHVYEGAFENGLFQGQGKLSGEGVTYTGGFAKGVADGEGEQVFADGRKYRGQFRRGHYEGKGRYENGQGDVFEGDFKNDEFVGKGRIARKDGGRYEGEVQNWRPHGKGIFTEADGTVYEGRFVRGELTGKGRMTGKDGTRYEGEFKNWQYHGQGVFRFANGDEYTGGFARGFYEGAGTLTYAAAQRDGRRKDSGTWHNGVLDDKDAETRTKRNVEQALYLQRPLLDQAFAALKPHETQDKGRINMYLLAVAGDGSQEVFRREVEFVRAQFDRGFGTAGRSLALINSRTTVTSVPMATQTSLREALQAIAAKMDKDNDVLFLFLTSHGSKHHELSLNQNGMDLPDLPAGELAKLLKGAGIRWKVVVVSACYSGGFIDPLKDQNTMVITAARHDRTSFGCADDNDFTYFGRAFFKESLPRTRDFSRAFDDAKVLIDQWEKRELASAKGDADEGGAEKEAGHSLPQIWQPAPIKAQLERWRAQLK